VKGFDAIGKLFKPTTVYDLLHLTVGIISHAESITNADFGPS
jgi:hypothetical protein